MTSTVKLFAIAQCNLQARIVRPVLKASLGGLYVCSQQPVLPILNVILITVGALTTKFQILGNAFALILIGAAVLATYTSVLNAGPYMNTEPSKLLLS